MLQRFVIEDFLRMLFDKLESEVLVDHIADYAERDDAVIRFVQDWLEEHKGEL